MPVYDLGGYDVHVVPWQTSWPVSIFYKQQGVEVKINPESHWWCLWLCSTTEEIDHVDLRAELTSALVPNAVIDASCDECGDLTARSEPSWGYSAPWVYLRADFAGSIRVEGGSYSFKGQFLYS
jgi:hypothetical protein